MASAAEGHGEVRHPGVGAPLEGGSGALRSHAPRTGASPKSGGPNLGEGAASPVEAKGLVRKRLQPPGSLDREPWVQGRRTPDMSVR